MLVNATGCHPTRAPSPYRVGIVLADESYRSRTRHPGRGEFVESRSWLGGQVDSTAYWLINPVLSGTNGRKLSQVSPHLLLLKCSRGHDYHSYDVVST